jgi:hypothetical protein
MKPRPHLVHQSAQPSTRAGLWHGLLDELRLASFSVRGNHEPPRQLVGTFASQLLPCQMQAGIQASGGACRGEYAPLLYVEQTLIEHITLDSDQDTKSKCLPSKRHIKHFILLTTNVHFVILWWF